MFFLLINTMSDIPSEVLRGMLLRLPAQSLFRFRTVCKQWRCLIDDPSFIKSHATNQNSSTTLLIRTPAGTPIYYLSLDSLNFSNGQQVVDLTRVKTLVHKDVPRIPLLPVASCNGLILISPLHRNKVWAIWNPLTREFIDLPPQPDDRGFLIGSGLGYDHATDDYKAVRIEEDWRFDPESFRRKLAYKTRVYSLKLDSWKIIKDCPCDFPEGDQGVFLNGALHWRSWNTIVALDLETEDYRQLPHPPVRAALTSDLHFGALGGYLIVSYYSSIWRFDGVQESWTMLYSFEKLYIGGNPRPVVYLESKGQVILQDGCKFYWLDIEKNTAKKFAIDDLPYHCTCQIWPGSLFRLPYCCDDDTRKVAEKSARKRQRKNDRRLKYSVTVCDIWCRSDPCCSHDPVRFIDRW